MEEKKILYQQKEIFYQASGQGSLVVLLHGFGEDAGIWKNQLSLFRANRLIVPNLPGTGNSPLLDDMSMESLAKVVKAIVNAETFSRSDDLEDGDGVVVIGHSMGGYVALAYAEKYPDLLSGLGLFHSSAFADTEEKKVTRQKGIQFIQQHGAKAFLETIIPNLYAEENKKKNRDLMKEHLTGANNFSAAALVSYYEAMMQRKDRTDVLRQAKVPVLFVLGRWDSAVSAADMLKQCHLPQTAYIHILEHSGHTGMIEETEKTNTLLTDFIAAIENRIST